MNIQSSEISLLTSKPARKDYFGGPCEHFPMDAPNSVCVECLAKQLKTTHELLKSIIQVESEG